MHGVCGERYAPRTARCPAAHGAPISATSSAIQRARPASSGVRFGRSIGPVRWIATSGGLGNRRLQRDPDIERLVGEVHAAADMRFAGDAGQAAGVEHQIAMRDAGAELQPIETGRPERNASLAAASADFGSGFSTASFKRNRSKPGDHAVVHRQRGAAIERRQDRRRAVAARGKPHAGIGAARQQIDRCIVQRAGDEASLTPACKRSEGGSAAASNATLPDTVPQPSFAVN